MNIQQFNHLVNSTDQSIGTDDTKQLENLVTIFPYCQTGHLLLSKASKEQGNMTSEMRIKTASAYSVNRRHLKRFLLEKIAYPKVDKVLPNVYPKGEEKNNTNQPLALVDNLIEDQEEIVVTDRVETIIIIEGEDDPVDEVVLDATGPIVDINYKEVKEGEVKQELSIAEEIHKSLEELRKLKEEAQIDLLKKEIDLDFVSSSVSIKKALILVNKTEEPLDILVNETDEILITHENKTEVEEQKLEEVNRPIAIHIEKDTLDKGIQKKTTVNIKDKLKALSKKVKAEGEQKAKRAKKKQGEVFYHQPNEDLFDSKLGESGGKKENSEADLILKYLESLDKKKTKKASRRSQTVILDDFIKNEPKISRVKVSKSRDIDKQEDFSKHSGTLKLKVVNENMAKIHANQGNTGKAIKIYKELMLRKPEKKSYFATQIEKLKK